MAIEVSKRSGEGVPSAGSGESRAFGDLADGQVVGRYRIERRIARGGMGVVYEAMQLELGRAVALKVLAPRGAELPSDLSRRFAREAALVAQLDHPNIVVVHEYGSSEGIDYIAMELVHGRTLTELVHEEGPQRTERIAHIGRQICDALAAAHARGLVHRDVKPSNILLTTRGRDVDVVKVVDFGLGKTLDATGMGENTGSGVLIGSPHYIAPEQVLGHPVTTQADLYGLGGVLYFLATGSPPFVRRSDFLTVSAHVSETPPSFRDTNPSCEAAATLEAIALRCLEKDAARRPKDAAEVAELLDAVVVGRGDESTLARMGLPSDPGVDAPRRPRRGHARGIAYGLVGAGVVAIVGVLALRSAGPAHPPAESSAREGEAPPTTPEVLPRPGEATAPASAEDRAPGGTAIATRAVAITSSPTGAVVRRGGVELGSTPLVLELPQGATWVVSLERGGYQLGHATLAPEGGDVLIDLRRSGRASRERAEPELATQEPSPSTAPASTAVVPGPPTRRTDTRDPWQ